MIKFLSLNMYAFALLMTLWAFSAVKATDLEDEELDEKRGYFLNKAHKRELGDNEEEKRYLVHSFLRPSSKRAYFRNEALKGLANEEEKRDFFDPEYLDSLDKRGFFTREMLDHLGEDGKKRGYFTQEMLDRLGEEKKRGYFSREMVGSLGQDGD